MKLSLILKVGKTDPDANGNQCTDNLNLNGKLQFAKVRTHTRPGTRRTRRSRRKPKPAHTQLPLGRAIVDERFYQYPMTMVVLAHCCGHVNYHTAIFWVNQSTLARRMNCTQQASLSICVNSYNGATSKRYEKKPPSEPTDVKELHGELSMTQEYHWTKHSQQYRQMQLHQNNKLQES